MDRDGRFWRVLEHLADTVVAGLFTLVASLPVVTAPAALSAAGAALQASSSEGSLPVRYWVALRSRLRTGSQVGAAALALGSVAVVDLVWATSEPLTPLRTMVLAAGALVLLTTSSLTAVAVARLAAPDHTSAGPATSGELGAGTIRQLAAASALQGGAAPHRVLSSLVLTALGAGLVALLPVLAPLALGLVARALPRFRASLPVLHTHHVVTAS